MASDSEDLSLFPPAVELPPAQVRQRSAEIALGHQERWRIDQEDCNEWLSRLAPRSVDLIVTDPAYESLEKHRDHGTTVRLTNWFPVVPNVYFHSFFLQAWRVLKSNAHCYVLVDQETMFEVKPIAEQHGFKFWKPIVWVKDSIGMGYHYRARYEFVLFFEKGERKLNDLGIPDVIEAPRVRGRFPTEKPVELLQVLIAQSTSPGDLVIDPFCGSGSTGEAALSLGRTFMGCDVQPNAVETARDRMTKVGTDEG